MGNALFLLAGEPSGDLYGGDLLRALRQLSPETTYRGVGGPRMRAEGLDLLFPMESLQVMGITDVLTSLPRLLKLFRTLREAILTQIPDTVVFIDYPDFHMRLAASLRRRGYRGKLVHYICPSVWAWRRERVEALARSLDLLLCILPFEPELFAKTSLEAHYVGHPLLSLVERERGKRLVLPEGALGLFPGSRRSEVRHNLPLQLAALERLGLPGVISSAHGELTPLIRSLLGGRQLPIVEGESYALMQSISGALATSGTVALELALYGVPSVVHYELTRMHYLLGRYVLRIRPPFFALPNIILGREIFPEAIGHKLDPAGVASYATEVLGRGREACLADCREVRRQLEGSDGSLSAAQRILQLTK